ncbi:PLCD3 isoform 12, partial [Pan troglodytes]
VNGQCGYVLKPACLRQPDSTFDPEYPGPPRTTLSIQVLTAQQLPKLNAEKPHSIVDPLVRVEIHGVPADCARQETDYVLNNGYRHIHLLSKDGASLSPATLFIQIRIQCS